MKRVCAWCGKHLGEKTPVKDNQITHSICNQCKEKELDKDALRQNGMVATPILQARLPKSDNYAT